MTRTIAATCLLLTLATGCGGGGGGGGPVNPPPPPPPPTPSAFPPPVISYAGLTEAAQISEASAFDIGGGSLVAILFILSSLDFEVDFVSGIVSETLQGSGGGTAVITGNIDNAANGWLATRFNNFSEEGVVLNGRLQQRENDRVTTFEFTELRFAADGQELVLNGTIRHEIFFDLERETFLVDLELDDLVTPDSVWMDNVLVDVAERVTITGRIYDTDQGFIDLTTESGFFPRYFEDGRSLYGGGPMTVTGAADNTLRVYVLSDDAVSFVLEELGADPRTLRVNTTKLFNPALSDADTRQGPLVAAGIRVVDMVPGEILLDGLASHDNEDRWLTHSWKVLLRPTNSSVQVPQPGSPLASVVLDELGSYLFELTVSNGIETNTDSVHITRSTNDIAGNRARVDRVRGATAGVEVIADGRASMRSMAGDDLQWSLSSPSGSQATIASPGGGEPTSFVPDTDGFYGLIVSLDGGQGFPASSLQRVVPVGVDFDFHPPVLLYQPAAFEAGIVAIKALAETNGDQQRDLIEQYRVPALDQVFVGLFSSQPDGFHQFSGGFEFVQHNAVTTGDLDGDGRDEIIAPFSNEIQVYTETAGQLGMVTTLGFPTECPTESGNQAAHVADADGDGRQDLFVTDGCRNQVFLWEQTASGDFEPQPPTDITFPDYIWIGDIDGDGQAELLKLNLTEVQFYSRQQTGAYQPSMVVQLSNETLVGNEIHVADINGDGLKDIVACQNLAVIVAAQSAPGVFDAGIENASDISERECVFGDINNDGRTDIVFEARSGLGEFGFAIQRPDGTLKFVEHVSSGTFRDISVGDINGDGLADLAGDGGIRLGR